MDEFVSECEVRPAGTRLMFGMGGACVWIMLIDRVVVYELLEESVKGK